MKTNKKILLVEDDPNFGRILKDYLTINNYEVTLAVNGIEGFEKFNKSEFNLCILDIMMPFKDGLTLAKEIREINETIPLIFLTAKNLKDDVLKGYKIGADDYLTKPFDSEILLAKIKSILNRKPPVNTDQEDVFEFDFGEFSFNSKIFLTAKNLKDDVLKGYKIGADDYLTKPFDSEILLAKIKSILNRKPPVNTDQEDVFEFDFGEFSFNSKLRILNHKDGKSFKLSPKENQLLKMLVLNFDDLLPRDIALNKIWRDANYFTSRSMDVYIAKLRKYLEKDVSLKIINVHGEGFRLMKD